MTSEDKKKRNTYDKKVVQRLIEKYGLGKRYITMCLSGDVNSEMADRLVKDYTAMNVAVDNLLKTL